MARPPLNQSQRKTRTISFRLTEAEFLRLAQNAAAANLPVNSLARKLTVSKVAKLLVKAERSHNPALVKQLYYIGHNLNQLVKNAHIFGRVSPRIEQLCQRIEMLMDEAIGKDEE